MRFLHTEQVWIAAAGSLIEGLAACVVAYHVLWAIAAILGRKGSDVARLRIAQGVLTALGFSLAGTLLKTIALQTWPQIRLFAFVFILRQLLKRVFLWEENAIHSRRSDLRRGREQCTRFLAPMRASTTDHGKPDALAAG